METLKARDPDYFRKIGAKGGKKLVPKGFSTMSREKHLQASIKGGSRKKKA